MFGSHGCRGNPSGPGPDVAPREDLPAAVPVAGSEEGDGAAGDEPGEIPVEQRDERMKPPPISPTTFREPVSHLMGHLPGDVVMELGVEAGFILEETPRVEPVGGGPVERVGLRIGVVHRLLVFPDPFLVRTVGTDHPAEAVVSKSN